MNNPGIDFKIWEQFKKKWANLDASGRQVKVEFKLITTLREENKVLAIDVIQHIDSELVTETVQHIAGEGYELLGIAGLSMERLVEVYKGMMNRLMKEHGQYKDMALTVTMTPTSIVSGQVNGIIEKIDASVRNSILVNYRHYYVLNALREKMIEALDDEWSKVTAVYRSGELEFYFDY
jgi:hypothetical protein